MKSILCFFFTMVFLQASAQRSTKVTIKLPALNCEECEKIIENKIWKAVDGITSIDVKWKRKSVTLTYLPDRIDLENIRIILADLGFDADDEKADEVAMKKLPVCCRRVAVVETPKVPVQVTPTIPVPPVKPKVVDTVVVKPKKQVIQNSKPVKVPVKKNS